MIAPLRSTQQHGDQPSLAVRPATILYSRILALYNSVNRTFNM